MRETDLVVLTRDVTDRGLRAGDIGTIVLDKDSSQYKALRTLFLTRANIVGPEVVGWSEVVEAVYSKAELEQCELLTLHINGAAGLGGNAYAEVYGLENCSSCGFVRII